MVAESGWSPIGEPFFFGGIRPLFATFHAPRGRQLGAVVLLYPLGHEYVRAHRAFRNLSLSLTGMGLAVLRFDYTGTGDSAGESAELRADGLLEDVDAAVAECRRRTGAEGVTLVGLRLGAALAILAAGRRPDIQRVVAWDPVVDGRTYIMELRALQSSWLRDRLGAATRQTAGSDELLGLEVRPEFLADLENIRLFAAPLPAGRVDVFESRPREDTATWVAHWQQRGASVAYAHVQSAGDWDTPEAVHQLLLPHEMLRRITSALTPGA